MIIKKSKIVLKSLKKLNSLVNVNLWNCEVWIRKNKWDKVFKNGPSKVCGRQPLKNLKGYGLLEADHTPSNF